MTAHRTRYPPVFIPQHLVGVESPNNLGNVRWWRVLESHTRAAFRTVASTRAAELTDVKLERMIDPLSRYMTTGASNSVAEIDY